MDPAQTSLAWHDIVGILGVASILVAYAGVQSGKLRVDQLAYSLVNGLGASLVVVSLLHDFNLSAFVIESAWIAISLYGVVRWVIRRRSARADAQEPRPPSGLST